VCVCVPAYAGHQRLPVFVLSIHKYKNIFLMDPGCAVGCYEAAVFIY